MAFKQFEIEGIGAVKFYKRRSSRSIKISLSRGTEVRVSLPAWVPYRTAIEFARTKTEWVAQHRLPISRLLPNKQIGKAHRLRYLASSVKTPSTRVTLTEIKVTHPLYMSYQTAEVQIKATNASLKALKQEADQLLPQRLNQLAKQHQFNYRAVSVKNLRSRWGSCNAARQISLNIHLMQLPWPLIDYVLVHELTHTEHLNHSPDFWLRLESCLPNFKELRKQLKDRQPIL